jgi:5'-3' exonuclease
MSNVVIDGSPLIYASYFSLHEKLSWWMVFGVLNSILTIIEEEKPSTLAIVWGSRKIDKRAAYPLYRTGSRVKIDFDQKQFSRIGEILANLDVCQLQMDGLEADQILAAYVNSLQDCVIISDDKDFFQLLSDTKVMKGARRGYWDGRMVMKSYNLKTPSMFADWQALAGDPVDTIPRILYTRDVVTLLNTKGYLKTWLLKSPPDLSGVSERVSKRLLENMEQIKLNYMLTNLCDERLAENMILPTSLNLDFVKDKLTKMQMSLFLRKFDRFAALANMNLHKKREFFRL